MTAMSRRRISPGCVIDLIADRCESTSHWTRLACGSWVARLADQAGPLVGRWIFWSSLRTCVSFVRRTVTPNVRLIARLTAVCLPSFCWIYRAFFACLVAEIILSHVTSADIISLPSLLLKNMDTRPTSQEPRRHEACKRTRASASRLSSGEHHGRH
jgi:hypothetical protein